MVAACSAASPPATSSTAATAAIGTPQRTANQALDLTGIRRARYRGLPSLEPKVPTLIDERSYLSLRTFP
ncbi:hypothetical protein GCM10010341_48290 [Streptomyces noursei]|nr:hypothetical protein GCM10010341_48290 [Streptomyces noursei]